VHRFVASRLGLTVADWGCRAAGTGRGAFMTGGTGLYPAVLRSPPGSGPARGLLRVPGRRL